MIPINFEEWKNCIVNDCRIKLDQEFIQKRLSVYQDPKNKETKLFVSHYGEQHLQNVIGWLKRVEKLETT